MIRRLLARWRPVPDPTPPTNVRFETVGHGTIPVDCVYRGLDDHGNHVWAATAPVGVPVKSLHADVIPAKTSVVVTCTGGWATS